MGTLGSPVLMVDVNGDPAIGGVGDMTLIPNGTTNGTALGAKPTNAVGVRLYLNAADSVTFTVAGTAPTGAPAATITLSGSAQCWDESLNANQMVYVTAKSGSPSFRWY